MSKSKFEDFLDDSQFKYWSIVISRFVWNCSRSVVAGTFGCPETYVTKVMNKFERDGRYVDHRQFNGGGHQKVTDELKEAVTNAIIEMLNITSPQIHEKMVEEVHEVHERTIRKFGV